MKEITSNQFENMEKIGEEVFIPNISLLRIYGILKATLPIQGILIIVAILNIAFSK